MKKQNIYNKIINVCILIILSTIFISNIANASVADIVNPTSDATGYFENPISIILGITQVIAIGLGTIMLIVIAIKYMSSAPGDKAEIKQHAVVYLVGAIIAFGASGIMEIFKGLVKESLS